MIDNTIFLPLALVLGLLVLLVCAGLEISFSMGVAALVGLLVFGRDLAWLQPIAEQGWSVTFSEILVALPLFVLMASILDHSGVTKGLFDAALAWVGRVPAGLCAAVQGSCAVFAAVCGSSAATAAAISVIALPRLDDQGYDRRISNGALAAGGTLGILIPPSIPLIVYALMTSTSPRSLFMAGIIPGVLLAFLFYVVALVQVLLKPSLAPKYHTTSWREKLLSLRSLIPVLVLVMGVLGTIYMGITTVSEAAGVGAFLAIVIALAYRKLTFKMLEESLIQAATTTSFLMLVVIAGYTIAFMASFSGFGIALANYVVTLALSKWGLILFLVILYTILGCFMDGLTMTVVTLPFLWPTIVKTGFDPVWFGIIMVVQMEISAITPPVAVNLFILQGVGKGKIQDVIMGALPYVAFGIGYTFLLTAFPQIVLILPQMLP